MTSYDSEVTSDDSEVTSDDSDKILDYWQDFRWLHDDSKTAFKWLKNDFKLTS